MIVMTIIVPCYNVEKYLNKTLKSLDFEYFSNKLQVLIVDDGSVDSTLDIAQKYVDKSPEIFRVISKTNGGHGSTINTGLQYAEGKYIRILDGDDWVSSDQLNKLLHFIEKNNTNVDMIFNSYRSVNIDTQKEIYFPLPSNVEENRVYNSLELHKNIKRFDFALTNCVLKTEILKTINLTLLEKTFYVDNEYIIKAVSQVNNAIFLNFDIYRYLIGNENQSISKLNLLKNADHMTRVIKACLIFYNNSSFDSVKMKFCKSSIITLVNTHNVLLLVSNPDKKSGREKAEELKKLLVKDDFYKFVRFKYAVLKLMNLVCINDKSFAFMNSIRKRFFRV
ncbi:glycosyltransferase family 2 protein [Oceanispirochaeta sp. M2]|uniref:glycosyltransferase family 2 protein n=1 Tax=Oceanispirochaeta sp. M2 TaxID=2735869 RepID=UPI0015528746|nr:glycosyltransferase family 2 protein [Oceanispirochaeta sp. M2]MBF9017747.1 glycosyltransferase family 2 protein [Oceanispirochaeta sp. M2]